VSYLLGMIRPRTLLALIGAALVTSLAFAAVSSATRTVKQIQGDPIPGVDVSIEQSPPVGAADLGTGPTNSGANGFVLIAVAPPATCACPPPASSDYNSKKSNTAGIALTSVPLDPGAYTYKNVRIATYLQRHQYGQLVQTPTSYTTNPFERSKTATPDPTPAAFGLACTVGSSKQPLRCYTSGWTTVPALRQGKGVATGRGGGACCAPGFPVVTVPTGTANGIVLSLQGGATLVGGYFTTDGKPIRGVPNLVFPAGTGKQHGSTWGVIIAQTQPK
jgi:hypothetical protein